MEPTQAIEILLQVQAKFVASGQDHRLLSDAIKTLSEAVATQSDEPSE